MPWWLCWILLRGASLVLAENHRNVLMLIADDLRPNVGPYQEVNSPYFNSPAMITPNIDALAEKSLVLTKAYTQVALCGPSRNSFLTGRRADTTRCYVTNDRFREKGGEAFVTLPQFFKDNGYKSVGAGKVFHPGIPNTPKGDDYPKSWSSPLFHTATTDDNSYSWHAHTQQEMEETPLRDIVNADHAIQLLRELAPDALLGVKPFFLAFGLHKPHMPWDFPEEFLDLYPEEDISMPANPYIPDDMPPSAWSNPTGLLNYPDCNAEGTGIPDIGQPNVTYSEKKIKELRRAYYASISFADQQLGRVLDELETLGLAENTVVVFLGDHGLHMGEHSEWDKYTNFEIAHRAPLMIRVPGFTNGEVSDKLVEFVDIYPTVVEAAGFERMAKCPEYSRNVSICTEGSSLVKMMVNPDGWKEAIFWQQPRGYWTQWQKEYQGYTVLTKEWRYSEYINLINIDEEDQVPDWNNTPEDFGELYDLINDPLENVNLYRNHDYIDTKVALRKILHKGWAAYN